MELEKSIAWYVEHISTEEGTNFLISHRGPPDFVPIMESAEAIEIMKAAIAGGYKADERELEALKNGDV